MALRVIDRVYTDLEGRTGKSMQGNYLDKSIVQYDVEYEAKLCLSDYVTVIKKGNLFTLTSGSWDKLITGFNGANIKFIFEDDPNATPITTTIDYVDGATMALNGTIGYPDGPKRVGYFQVTDAPELFEVDFNLVQNSVAGSRFSLIDSETQRFSVVLVNTLTVGGGVDNFIQLGDKSGGSYITATIDQIATVAGNLRYTILINYKNPLLFKRDHYKADDCIGDYARIRATAQRGNDNVFVETKTKNIGDTGYENEALNGGAFIYDLTSLVWTDDSANVMTAMDYSQPSNFAINITGTFSADIKYGVKLFMLPQGETEYKNTALNVERNLSLCMNDVLIANAVPTTVNGETNANGAAFDISGFTVTDNTTNIDVVGKVTPNAAMIALLKARSVTDKDYKLLIVCDDTTKAYKDVNTTNILIEKNNAIKNVISLGAWPDLATLTFKGSDGVVIGGIPAPLAESACLINATFTLPKLAATLSNPWRKLTGQIVAVQTSTGAKFAYEAFIYDVSQLPNMPDETLSIAYNQTRGRKLPAASEFNSVEFLRNGTLDTGTDFGVSLNYAFQIGYQDWIEVPAVSDYFYGEKNNDWYNVSSNADWQLKFELLLENEDGVYTDSQDFDVTNYGAWTGTEVITYKDEDSNVVTRPLANQLNEITVVETGLKVFTGGTHATISVRDQNGVTLGQITTDQDPITNGNPLKPILGETRLKITVVGAVATLVCSIDTKLIDVKTYTIVTEFNGDV